MGISESLWDLRGVFESLPFQCDSSRTLLMDDLLRQRLNSCPVSQVTLIRGVSVSPRMVPSGPWPLSHIDSSQQTNYWTQSGTSRVQLRTESLYAKKLG